MVKVRRLLHVLLIAIIMLSSNSNFASPQLLVIKKKNIVEIGRPLKLELIGVSLKSKIGNINLEKLKTNFGVVTDYAIDDVDDERWPNKNVQILYLKLYPRKIGLLSISSLKIDNVTTKELSINSIKGKESIPQTQVSFEKLYVRQQFIVQVSLLSTELSSQLEINPNSQIKGFESQALSFKRTKTKEGKYLTQIGWALTALKVGQQEVSLPVISYSVSGVLRKQFYLPNININIHALPSYLSPTIPVGKISITSSLTDKLYLATNTLSYWNLNLSGSVNNSYQLPPILRQIKSNNEIHFLPANSTRTSDNKVDKFISHVNHSIPFKTLKNGFITLPTIQLQYFDPETGKIKSIIQQSQNVLALNLFWRSVIFIILLVVITWASLLIYNKWKRVKYSKLKYQEAINLLKNNSNKELIRKALTLVAEAESWETNLTLTRWAELWSKKYITTLEFKNFYSDLSDLLYQSDNEGNVSNLSDALVIILDGKNIA